MLLRAMLVLGMVVHKLVWEALKPKSKIKPLPRQPISLPKRIVKLGKVGFLAFLIFQTLFLDLFPVLENSTPLVVTGLSLYTLGLTTAIVGRIQLGENWSNLEDREVKSKQDLVTRGIYGHIRHPIYTGDVLLVLGLELALNSWLFLVVIPLAWVVYRQTRAEEVQLEEAFPGYQDYRQQTKMFIPFVV